ncbi:uncharacterized protein LOC121381828 [Gigantopelta aegis]|uniref:uncharacterized protein LOC121381828 n=1 Tax=Gigantopelta aegis TaxID=1735272 RepID=UPI001B88A325|nr:uncharacterized protein LOC121381828 [Gigantopelta aegis]XP_041367124.1 uncharacterized protein LOC121381828 [Gigantopelta aegis]
MMVYIWLPNSSHVGHASLELSNGRYISWWPDEGKKKSKPLTIHGSSHESLEDDVEAEERDPDKTFDLDDLDYDEEDIEDWWIEWSNRGSYFLLGTNCCWVVYEALRHGGAPISPNPIWTPSILYRYLVRVTEGFWAMLGTFPITSLI